MFKNAIAILRIAPLTKNYKRQKTYKIPNKEAEKLAAAVPNQRL